MKCQKKHTACFPLFRQPLKIPEISLYVDSDTAVRIQKAGEAAIKKSSFTIHRKLYPFAFLMRMYDQRVLFKRKLRIDEKLSYISSSIEINLQILFSRSPILQIQRT